MFLKLRADLNCNGKSALLLCVGFAVADDGFNAMASICKSRHEFGCQRGREEHQRVGGVELS